jgi:hypothetical protein
MAAAEPEHLHGVEDNRVIRSFFQLSKNRKGPLLTIPQVIQVLLSEKKRDLNSKKVTEFSEFLMCLLGQLAAFMYQKEKVYNTKMMEFENSNELPDELSFNEYLGKPQQLQDVRIKKSLRMITILLPFMLDDYDRMNANEKYYFGKIVAIGHHAEKNGIPVEFETLDGTKILPSVCHDRLPEYEKKDEYGRPVIYNGLVWRGYKIYTHSARP